MCQTVWVLELGEMKTWNGDGKKSGNVLLKVISQCFPGVTLENYEKTQSAKTSVHIETWVEQIALLLTAKLSVCLSTFYI